MQAPSETLFLIQILVLVAAGRLMGEAMQRVGQPAVMGQLLAGLLLGPSVLGLFWPTAEHVLFPRTPGQKELLNAVANLGVLMLLLLTGMETDLRLARRIGRAALSVSVSGIVLPFACGVGLGLLLPSALLPHPEARLVAALMLGTALSISSVKIVALVVRDLGFLRRNVGQVILASAVIDDTIGWVIIAVTFSLAGHGPFDWLALAKSLIGTAVFLALSLTVGRRLVFQLIRWTNDNFVSEVPVISLILLLMGGMALITDAIGVHTVLGAFVAGILVGESPILTRQIDQQLRGLITALFMPVFFGLAGLNADLTILKSLDLLLLTLGLIAIATVGKFAGAFLGGALGGMSRAESLALACGMNARGSTEVIVATIGLSLGIMSESLFTMVVAMAILTTLAMPPMLRWALGRLPLQPEEKARLEREETEARGFLPNLERLLLAVDESDNGKVAAALAGTLAGARGMPTTVLHVGRDAKRQEQARHQPESPEAAVKAGAKAMAATDADPDPRRVEVTTRANRAPMAEAVADEARKGHDLIVIGVDPVADQDGTILPRVTAIAAGFEGPLAILDARGPARQTTRPPRRILVPVSGAESSRRAAEVAIALARAYAVPVTALYVALRGSPEAPRPAPTATRRFEEAILREVVELADQQGVTVRTRVRAGAAPHAAILAEARAGRFDLIVMGVNRRPGERLFFGDTAAAVLRGAEASLLLLSS